MGEGGDGVCWGEVESVGLRVVDREEVGTRVEL